MKTNKSDIVTQESLFIISLSKHHVKLPVIYLINWSRIDIIKSIVILFLFFVIRIIYIMKRERQPITLIFSIQIMNDTFLHNLIP